MNKKENTCLISKKSLALIASYGIKLIKTFA